VTRRSPVAGLSFACPRPGLCDLVLLRAGIARHEPDIGTQLSQQSGHRRVVGRNQRGEAADAFLVGPVGQLREQLPTPPAILPRVEDGHRNVGGLRIFGMPDVARDTQVASVEQIQGAEGLVVVVVDVGEWRNSAPADA
jgi:hypothetical protein